MYCTQFGAHVFDARRLDAQSFATLLYHTIAIQLHNYTSATTTTRLPLYCHSATLLPLALAHFGCTPTLLLYYIYTAS